MKKRITKLAITRNIGESIMIGETKVTYLSRPGRETGMNEIKLMIEAPEDIIISRTELCKTSTGI